MTHLNNLNSGKTVQQNMPAANWIDDLFDNTQTEKKDNSGRKSMKKSNSQSDVRYPAQKGNVTVRNNMNPML